MTTTLLLEIGLVAVCLFLGGVLKGATGAGAPVLVVPVLALIFDVRFAIVVMVMPNLLSNLMQSIQENRDSLPERRFLWSFVGSGVVGVGVGTWLLLTLPLTVLPLFVAVAVFGYVALRLARPDWVLSQERGNQLAPVAGFVGGVLQGAAGLSAPASITFLNAMRLPRLVFVATIATLFCAFCLVQLPALWLSGAASTREFLIGVAAFLPLAAGMPVGAAIARRVRPEVFDKAILVLLTLIALRLFAEFFL